MVAEKAANLSDIEYEDDLDEEPGEVIEPAPPQKVGEERELHYHGLKKKFIKRGHGWGTPGLNDEVAIHYVGTLLDRTKFDSTRDRGEPISFTLGQAQVATGLDHGIITMKMGEVALFTFPAESGYTIGASGGIPPNAVVQFEVELISWITVVDICKEGGILKKIMEKGNGNERPSDLEEGHVKFQGTLVDGTVVAETPERVEFHVNDDAFGEKGREAGSGVNAAPPLISN